MNKSWSLQCFTDIFLQNQTNLVGDQIILPTSILEELTQDDSIKSPYVFSITTEKTFQTISKKVSKMIPKQFKNMY